MPHPPGYESVDDNKRSVLITTHRKNGVTFQVAVTHISFDNLSAEFQMADLRTHLDYEISYKFGGSMEVGQLVLGDFNVESDDYF